MFHRGFMILSAAGIATTGLPVASTGAVTTTVQLAVRAENPAFKTLINTNQVDVTTVGLTTVIVAADAVTDGGVTTVGLSTVTVIGNDAAPTETAVPPVPNVPETLSITINLPTTPTVTLSTTPAITVATPANLTTFVAGSSPNATFWTAGASPSTLVESTQTASDSPSSEAATAHSSAPTASATPANGTAPNQKNDAASSSFSYIGTLIITGLLYGALVD